MPKGGKRPDGEKKKKKEKKEKKEDKDKEEKGSKPEPTGDNPENAGGEEGEAGPAPTGRPDIGSPAFMKQVDNLTKQNMQPVSKKEEQRKSAKADVKSALQACLDITAKSLKMCNTSSSAYLLEHIQADSEKLKIHLAQDEDYIEEVRFKHNKMMDLLDETRDYQPVNLQKDLVRNREIRTKCQKLTSGDVEKEELVDQDEMNELLKIRNSIRTWYGGQNMLKGSTQISDAQSDASMFAQNKMNSDIRVNSGAAPLGAAPKA